MITYPHSPSDEITLLEELIRYYSPTGQEQEAVAYLVRQMSQWGFEAYIDEVGNAIGNIGTGDKQIILLGHIDTVPGEIPLQHKQDSLFGRGSVDAKGALACFTSAAARMGAASGWKFTVIGAVGEEGDSRGAKYLRERYQPHALIIGEPSGWERITLGYKGSAWMACITKQKHAHYAANIQTACELAFDFWNNLKHYAETYNQKRHKVFEQLTPTLTEMASQNDGFEQIAELKVNLRLPPEVSIEEIIQALSIHSSTQVFIEGETHAYRAEKNTPLVRAFLAAIRAEGGKPGFTLKSGTSDMNIVAPLWHCQTVAYGPGDSTLDHTAQEHISIAEYLRSINILEETLCKLCG